MSRLFALESEGLYPGIVVRQTRGRFRDIGWTRVSEKRAESRDSASENPSRFLLGVWANSNPPACPEVSIGGSTQRLGAGFRLAELAVTRRNIDATRKYSVPRENGKDTLA